jgi:glycosyltransferase involved in cell wall biosynthesis
LLEALSAGLPAVCVDHLGARSVMSEEFGELAPASELRSAIARLLADDARRSKMGAAARAFAATEKFSERAAILARWLLER